MAFYQENGYLLLKNRLIHRLLDDLMSTVAHIISLEAGVNESDLPKEEILNKVLIDL